MLRYQLGASATLLDAAIINRALTTGTLRRPRLKKIANN